MLEPREAAARIVAALTPLPAQSVALIDAAGLVLSAPVHAPIAMPRWTNSAMDGYACHSADLPTAVSAAHPLRLPVVAESRAGSAIPAALTPGTAVRVATGAPTPPGADTVIRVEDTDGGVGHVHITDTRDRGRNIRPAGEDVALGECVATAGTRLTPARSGLLASVGVSQVRVHRRVRVGIVATGDELVALDDFDPVARPDRIVSSNTVALLAAVRELGAEALDFGIVPDTREALAAVLARAAASCDLVLTTAGVSVGEHDHVKPVVESLDGALDFWRVRMRPGSPLAAGRIGRTPWIGLPGNPVSTLVTFTLFAAPAIRRLGGATAVFPAPLRVQAAEDIRISAPLTHYLRATLHPLADGTWAARLTGTQASNIASSVARADALLVIPPDRPQIAAGHWLTAIVPGPQSLLQEQP